MTLDQSPPEAQSGPGISRRWPFRAAAVVGGAVWVAPVVESITTNAAAAPAPSAWLNLGCW